MPDSQVLVTGVTGFVGEALLHLLLAEVPGVRTSVVVRPKGSITGADRIAKLLEKPVFAEVVEAAGGVEALMAARVGVVEGDLADVPVAHGDLEKLRAHLAARLVRLDPLECPLFPQHLTRLRTGGTFREPGRRSGGDRRTSEHGDG